jgi:hypothetical protein
LLSYETVAGLKGGSLAVVKLSMRRSVEPRSSQHSRGASRNAQIILHAANVLQRQNDGLRDLLEIKGWHTSFEFDDSIVDAAVDALQRRVPGPLEDRMDSLAKSPIVFRHEREKKSLAHWQSVIRCLK